MDNKKNSNSKSNYKKNNYKKNNSYSNSKKQSGNNKKHTSRELKEKVDKENLTKKVNKIAVEDTDIEIGNFSDELDTSFVEGRKKNKNKIIKDLDNSYIKQSKKIRKSQKNKKTNIMAILLFCLLGSALAISIWINFYLYTKPEKVKIEKQIKEVVIADDNYLFLGDSITECYDLNKYYDGLPVVNSGISGNISEDILDDMKNRVYQYNPSKIFLLIGTNDIQKGISLDDIVSNIKEIIKDIKNNRPYSEIYIESIYPVDEDKNGSQDRTNEEIMKINKELEKYCEKEKITYLDLFSLLKDEESSKVKIKSDYTIDGLHLSDEGYEVVTKEIKKYLK